MSGARYKQKTVMYYVVKIKDIMTLICINKKKKQK